MPEQHDQSLVDADTAWLSALSNGLADSRYDALQSKLIDLVQNDSEVARVVMEKHPDAPEDAVRRGMLRNVTSDNDSLLGILFEAVPSRA